MGVNVQAIELVFLFLLLFVIAFGALARKLSVPYPIVMVIGGLLLALVPGLPKVSLNPDFVFFVILPPLLYSAAWNTSWREFRRYFINIFLLAFGLVFFTVAGVAYGAPWLFPGFDWKIGLVLGAVVAPTDALAATSIAKRIGLPKQITDILEGESLVNDATGLLALEFGIALVARGHTLSAGEGVMRLVYLTAAGLVIGLLTGWIVYLIEKRIDDAPIEIAISILVPYAAYLAAEAAHASGVLAVVACGLYLSRRSSDFFSPGVRLQIWAFWGSLSFILNGLVFVLIGLQLPTVLEGLQGYQTSTLVLYGALFSALLIALRLIWVFPGAYLAYLINCRLLRYEGSRPPAKGIVVVGWTGMRGVIALAAAISLPHVLEDGSPFVQRNMIVFLSFSVILVTLVLQGLTLPSLVRFLRLSEPQTGNPEEEHARRKMLEAALAYLDSARTQDDGEFEEMYEDIVGHYQQRLNSLVIPGPENSGMSPAHHRRMLDISRELLRIERQTAVRLRNDGVINDETLRELERELDLREAGPPHAV